MSAAAQDSMIYNARRVGLTEPAAQTKGEMLAKLATDAAARERAHREAIAAIGVIHPDAAYRLAATLSDLPPWCPACGQYMEYHAAQPADPTVNAPAMLAEWECCGVHVNANESAPLDPYDNKHG